MVEDPDRKQCKNFAFKTVKNGSKISHQIENYS